MARIINFRNLGHKVFLLSTCSTAYRSSHTASLTQHEVIAALRPFYFAVHPDLFWQFPKEKEINENSLKLLNSYLETLLNNQQVNPTSVTFCLRNPVNKISTDPVFKTVSIQLFGRDLRATVRDILSSCQLSTHGLDPIVPAKKTVKAKSEDVFYKDEEPIRNWWQKLRDTTREVEEQIRSKPDNDFSVWLKQNVSEAERRSRACKPLREETKRLCSELKSMLFLSDIIWNCGWGITHFRGCLLSFRGLAAQHKDAMSVLKGRTVIFGKQTGVSFDGHIILSSEDVRNNWLDMIQSIDQFDSLLQQIPQAKRDLSEGLRGITIDHRKFQPTVMVQKYIQQLGKLTSALYKYRWKNGYPLSWPKRLEKFQLVVECEAGPLMLSPTGQFIVPASCPAFLLVDFITKNMLEADLLLEKYAKAKAEESDTYMKCMSELGLSSLEKDDNVTPDLMVECCKRLLKQPPGFKRNLRDLRLRISHYYSVLQDGDICIPWNWKQLSS